MRNILQFRAEAQRDTVAHMHTKDRRSIFFIDWSDSREVKLMAAKE